MPNGYKRRPSQCEAQKGLGESEEKEVLKMVLLKAEIFKSPQETSKTQCNFLQLFW